MPRIHRVLLGFLFFGNAVLLAGCPGDYDGGYEKISYREQEPLPAAAAPDPPPVVEGAGGAAGAPAPTLPPGAPAGVTQAMVEEGQQLYGTTCVACHAAGGAGSPAGPQLSDAQWLNIAGGFDDIAGVIQSGVPTPKQFPAPMPAMGGGSFTPDQVRSLAAYIFAISHQAGA